MKNLKFIFLISALVILLINVHIAVKEKSCIDYAFKNIEALANDDEEGNGPGVTQEDCFKKFALENSKGSIPKTKCGEHTTLPLLSKCESVFVLAFVDSVDNQTTNKGKCALVE